MVRIPKKIFKKIKNKWVGTREIFFHVDYTFKFPWTFKTSKERQESLPQ